MPFNSQFRCFYIDSLVYTPASTLPLLYILILPKICNEYQNIKDINMFSNVHKFTSIIDSLSGNFITCTLNHCHASITDFTVLPHFLFNSKFVKNTYILLHQYVFLNYLKYPKIELET